MNNLTEQKQSFFKSKTLGLNQRVDIYNDLDAKALLETWTELSMPLIENNDIGVLEFEVLFNNYTLGPRGAHTLYTHHKFSPDSALSKKEREVWGNQNAKFMISGSTVTWGNFIKRLYEMPAYIHFNVDTLTISI